MAIMKPQKLRFVSLRFVSLIVVTIVHANHTVGADGIVDGRDAKFWQYHSVIEAIVESVELDKMPLPVISIRSQGVVCGKFEIPVAEALELQLSFGSGMNLSHIPVRGERAIILMHNGKVIPFYLQCTFMPDGTPIVAYKGKTKDEIERLKKQLMDLSKSALTRSDDAPKSAFPKTARDTAATAPSTSSLKTSSGTRTDGHAATTVGKLHYHPVSPTSLNCANVRIVDDVLTSFEPANEVEQLYLGGTDVTSIGLKQLGRFKKLNRLELGYTQTNDDGLVAVIENTDLMVLSLSKTKVTGNGIRLLGSERRLVRLSLSETRISDDGLAGLKGLPELQELGLFRCGLSDAAIDTLMTLPKLRKLSLGEKGVTGKGISRLVACKNLEYLSLEESGITDEGLREVADLSSLKTLALINTKISDRGLDALSKHPNLGVVFLNDTQVTPAGLNRFLTSRKRTLYLSGFEFGRDAMLKLQSEHPQIQVPATLPVKDSKKP